MKTLLAHLLTGQPLSLSQATEAFEKIMTGQATQAQIAALLALIEMRNPSIDEIVAAARVMREKAIAVHVPHGMKIVDTCGSGGTNSRTFNISTTAGLVAAAAGFEKKMGVAKHGNKAVTSISGSSQVLEVLGVKLHVRPETLTRCLAETGFCFCHAPAHHPAMKFAAPVREELGFRTILNRLGPLTNPAGASRQVMGVSSPELLDQTLRVLQALGAEHAMTVISELPADATLSKLNKKSYAGELMTTGPSSVMHLRNGKIEKYEIDAQAFGLPRVNLSAFHIENPRQSAEVVRSVLAGKPGPARDVVLLNAAAALIVGDITNDWKEGIALASQAIDSHKAHMLLANLVDITQQDPTPA